MCWGWYTLSWNCGYQIKIVKPLFDDWVVNDCSWPWVVESSAVLQDHLGLHFGIAHHEHELWIFHSIDLCPGSFDLLVFLIYESGFLALTHTISVDDNSWRVNIIGLLEGLEGISKHWLELVTELAVLLLGPGEISVALLVHSCYQRHYWFLTSLRECV